MATNMDSVDGPSLEVKDEQPAEEEITVKLITPGIDPVNRPDEKIGSRKQNHFTYSLAKPGVLTIYLRAEVKPSGKADEAKDRVRFSVEGVGDSKLEWEGNAAGKPTKVSGDYLETSAKFTGLPKKNSDFGKKKATLHFDGVQIDERIYHVYFPKYGKNHPGSNVAEPNWFFYWKEGNVCGIDPKCEYDPNPNIGYGMSEPRVNDIVKLGTDAPEKNSGPETYTSSNTAYGSLTVTGQGKGIKCVAETIEHERMHIKIYKDFHSHTDSDADGIPDAKEPTLGGIKSDPNDPDTYNMGAFYRDYADEEIRCRKAELNLTIKYETKLDWANPGCQSKKKWGP